jgi:hypothetical protein
MCVTPLRLPSYWAVRSCLDGIRNGSAFSPLLGEHKHSKTSALDLHDGVEVTVTDEGASSCCAYRRWFDSATYGISATRSLSEV